VILEDIVSDLGRARPVIVTVLPITVHINPVGKEPFNTETDDPELAENCITIGFRSKL
jgi:hypothetical protein